MSDTSVRMSPETVAVAKEIQALTGTKTTRQAVRDSIVFYRGYLEGKGAAKMDTRSRDIIVIGRHKPNFGDIQVNIVGQENIAFGSNIYDVINQLRALDAMAKAENASIVFQNTPAIVGAALAAGAASGAIEVDRFGVTINAKIDRRKGISENFGVPTSGQRDRLVEAIKFANPRAKTERRGEVVTVTVDPVPEFVCRQIQWFDGTMWDE